MRSIALFGVPFLSAALSTIAQTPPPLLARPSVPLVHLTDEQVKGVIVSSPTPKYPAEARRRHLSGVGTFELAVSLESGEVISVTTVTSTGYPVLDRAAVKTLKLWRFRAHAVARVNLPITFAMNKDASRK